MAPLLLLTPVVGCNDNGGRTVLTVYSPHGRRLLEHYEKAFENENPDVDVRWIALGSNEILERVRAERENAGEGADVWFGAPTELFERAAREGLLDTISPSWKNSVTGDSRDEGNRWFGTYLTPEIIAYNSTSVPDSVAPHDWKSLGDPLWQDHLVLRDPVASGSMRAIFGAIMQESIERTQKTDSGWSLLRAIDRNNREYARSPEELLERLERGDGWITMYNMPDIATLQRSKNSPIRIVYPRQGTPVLVDAIALIKASNNRTFATRYIEFVTSREALKYAADSLQRIPARSDIPDSELPAWISEVRSSMTPFRIDYALMADSLDAWMRAWDSSVRGRNR